MRKLYAIVCLALLSGSYQAQETLPYYQQYLMDGEFLFNPAKYGSTDYVHVNANYQKQFMNFSESPNVQSLGVHANVWDRVGVGLSVFRDENGPYTSGGMTLGGSYFIPISDEGERQDQFSFGTSLTGYSMNIDYTKLNVEHQGDPNLQGDKENIFMLYANFGLAATYRDFFASASVNDIALNNDAAITNNVEPSPIKVMLNLGYNINLTEGFYITPSVWGNLNTNSGFMIDGNLMATVHNEFNKFSAGASFRYVQNRFDNQTLSLSPIVKVHLNKFMVSAVYNLGLSDIQDYGGNSFMLGLGFNFDNFINVRGFRY